MPDPSIGDKELQELCLFFISNSVDTRLHPTSRQIQERVNYLFRKDYFIHCLDNKSGQFCSSYPPQIVILENHKSGSHRVRHDAKKVNDGAVLAPLFKASRFSRVHGRFVVPTILCRSKNISRSSTVSIPAEGLLNGAKEFLGNLWPNSAASSSPATSSSSSSSPSLTPSPAPDTSSSSSSSPASSSNSSLLTATSISDITNTSMAITTLAEGNMSSGASSVSPTNTTSTPNTTATSAANPAPAFSAAATAATAAPAITATTAITPSSISTPDAATATSSSSHTPSLTVIAPAHTNLIPLTTTTSPTSTGPFAAVVCEPAAFPIAVLEGYLSPPTLQEKNCSSNNNNKSSISQNIHESNFCRSSTTSSAGSTTSSASSTTSSNACCTHFHSNTLDLTSPAFACNHSANKCALLMTPVICSSDLVPSPLSLPPPTPFLPPGIDRHNVSSSISAHSSQLASASADALPTATAISLALSTTVLPSASPISLSLPSLPLSEKSSPLLQPIASSPPIDSGLVGVMESKHSQLHSFASEGASFTTTTSSIATSNPTDIIEGTSPASDMCVGEAAEKRGFDQSVLDMQNIWCIMDLMVERRKRKLGLSITSSEKAEAYRYTSYGLNSVPYPGCEFFTEYKRNRRSGVGLNFDWSPSYVDAALSLVARSQPDGKRRLDIAESEFWKEYRSWDVIKLTQRYLKAMLDYIKDDREPCGMLVHCISGWDRTPLFISLLRLSLWADGEIHQNLNASEILYLTIAYDWMFFGHQLSNRLRKGEDVFYFCFDFLQYIATWPEEPAKRSSTAGLESLAPTPSAFFVRVAPEQTTVNGQILTPNDQPLSLTVASSSPPSVPASPRPNGWFSALSNAFTLSPTAPTITVTTSRSVSPVASTRRNSSTNLIFPTENGRRASLDGGKRIAVINTRRLSLDSADTLAPGRADGILSRSLPNSYPANLKTAMSVIDSTASSASTISTAATTLTPTPFASSIINSASITDVTSTPNTPTTDIILATNTLTSASPVTMVSSFTAASPTKTDVITTVGTPSGTPEELVLNAEVALEHVTKDFTKAMVTPARAVSVTTNTDEADKEASTTPLLDPLVDGPILPSLELSSSSVPVLKALPDSNGITDLPTRDHSSHVDAVHAQKHPLLSSHSPVSSPNQIESTNVVEQIASQTLSQTVATESSTTQRNHIPSLLSSDDNMQSQKLDAEQPEEKKSFTNLIPRHELTPAIHRNSPSLASGLPPLFPKRERAIDGLNNSPVLGSKNLKDEQAAMNSPQSLSHKLHATRDKSPVLSALPPPVLSGGKRRDTKLDRPSPPLSATPPPYLKREGSPSLTPAKNANRTPPFFSLNSHQRGTSTSEYSFGSPLALPVASPDDDNMFPFECPNEVDLTSFHTSHNYFSSPTNDSKRMMSAMIPKAGPIMRSSTTAPVHRAQPIAIPRIKSAGDLHLHVGSWQLVGSNCSPDSSLLSRAMETASFAAMTPPVGIPRVLSRDKLPRIPSKTLLYPPEQHCSLSPSHHDYISSSSNTFPSSARPLLLLTSNASDDTKPASQNFVPLEHSTRHSTPHLQNERVMAHDLGMSFADESRANSDAAFKNEKGSADIIIKEEDETKCRVLEPATIIQNHHAVSLLSDEYQHHTSVSPSVQFHTLPNADLMEAQLKASLFASSSPSNSAYFEQSSLLVKDTIDSTTQGSFSSASSLDKETRAAPSASSTVVSSPLSTAMSSPMNVLTNTSAPSTITASTSTLTTSPSSTFVSSAATIPAAPSSVCLSETTSTNTVSDVSPINALADSLSKASSAPHNVPFNNVSQSSPLTEASPSCIEAHPQQEKIAAPSVDSQPLTERAARLLEVRKLFIALYQVHIGPKFDSPDVSIAPLPVLSASPPPCACESHVPAERCSSCRREAGEARKSSLTDTLWNWVGFMGTKNVDNAE